MRFHRYLLSCYQQKPQCLFGTGYDVLLNLKDGSEESLASSIHYLRSNSVALKMCTGIPNCTIFDIGANIGQTAVAYSEIFPSAQIHSFEPFKENFDHLLENTKGNPRIQSHHMAMSDRNAQIEVKRDCHPLSQWNSIDTRRQETLVTSGSFRTEVINLTTGDWFCQQAGIEDICLLKIDTEGHELEVLLGLRDMISGGRVHFILVEAGFSGDSSHGDFQAINRFMLEHGMLLGGIHDPDYCSDGRANFVNAFYFRAVHISELHG